MLFGSTFHSQFCAPLDPSEDDTLNIGKRSDLAKSIKQLDLIVIDESVQLQKDYLA